MRQQCYLFGMFKALSEQKIPPFFYRRYSGESKILRKETYFGVIRPSEDPEFEAKESIYFFHGGDSDDQLFVQAGFLALLSEENRQKLLDRRIQIVLPFIGLSYLQDPFDRSLFEEVMPLVDRPSSRKMMYGVSMGGSAALNLLLKTPESFEAIATQFTGLIDFDPFSDSSSKEYQSATGITDEKLGLLRYCYQTPFRDYAHFQENDPIHLISAIDPNRLKNKRIYMDIGNRDDFGLQRGGRFFSEKMTQKGITHVFEIRDGAHDLAFIQAHFNLSFDFLLN